MNVLGWIEDRLTHELEQAHCDEFGIDAEHEIENVELEHGDRSLGNGCRGQA